MDNILIPCPPVEEQKAIVEKVEALMQKCQDLEQEIQTSEANAQMLMQAVLKEAFLPAETAVQASEGKQEEYAE
jgi:type I restriction enzyme S subunit